MPPPKTLDPLEALSIVTTKLKKSQPVDVAIDEARGLVLAEVIDGPLVGSAFPGDELGLERAAVDGYVLPRGVGVGDELEVTMTIADSSSRLGALPASGETCRVECGVALPSGAHSIVSAVLVTVIAEGVVRIEHLPEDGDGIVGRDSVRAGIRGPDDRVFERGTRIDARLQAFLLAAGRDSVRVFPQVRIGVIAFGAELTDLRAAAMAGASRASVDSEEAEGATISPEPPVSDLAGYWLADALRSLGARVFDLGTIPDDPQAFWRSLHACHTRDLDMLVLCGGLGDGLGDRTSESILDAQGQVFFEKLDAHGLSRFLFAKCSEVDVLGLSGEPLAMAAGFDLLARPSVLARSGLRREAWDWSLGRLPHQAQSPPPTRDAAHSPNPWIVAPAFRKILPQNSLSEVGEPAERLFSAIVHSWAPESPFAPVSTGADGWAVWPSDSRDGRAYYVPLTLTESSRSL